MLDWLTLTRLPDAELAKLDIAAVNLSCAAGLPEAHKIDYEQCLRTLDKWADRVRRYTDLALDQQSRRDPSRYQNSKPLFRVTCMVTALQKHCGVRYNASKFTAKPTDPFEFHEEFIHSIIQGNGGTCATLPVVYAAVGRRLGYPIHLACAPQRSDTQRRVRWP